MLDVRTGKVLTEFEKRDTPARIDRLADSMTFALVRELSHTPQIGSVRLSAVGTNSLGALKAFLQGEQYFRHSEWDSAAVVVREGARDRQQLPARERAARRDVRLVPRDVGDSLELLYTLRAAQHNRGLSPRDSLMIVAESLSAAIDDPKGDVQEVQHRGRLMAATEIAAQRYPDDPFVLYEYGDARYHYACGRKYGLPMEKLIEGFDRSIAADSTFTPGVHPRDPARLPARRHRGGTPLPPRVPRAESARQRRRCGAVGGPPDRSEAGELAGDRQVARRRQQR